METIKSRANPHVKNARQVRQGRIAGKFFVEGKRLVDDLIRSNIEIQSFLLTPRFEEEDQGFVDKLHDRCSNIRVLSAAVFASVSETKSPQGIAATCLKPADGRARLEKTVAGANRSIVIVLHGVGNPGNLGAVLRSAEAFGAVGVVVTKNSTDPFSSVSVRGSMGSIFRLPVWTGEGLETVIKWGRSFGMESVCADIEAVDDLSKTNWDRNLLVVFGSEAHGLKKEDLALVGEKFRIPIAPGVESLNLSVAAGIVLFEASRAHNL